MLRGTKVLIASLILALFMWLVNVIMLDSFLASLTASAAVSPSSGFYSGGVISRLAQLCTFMPILTVILGIGYYIFSRVFLQEGTDYQY